MKRTGFILLVLAATLMAFGTADNPLPKKMDIDVAKSTINWKGYKPTGKHWGTVALKSGTLELNGEKVKGSFVADMASLKDAEGNGRLEGHLKSADFFEVEVYPTATFEITGNNSNDGQLYLNGKMTIKGITKEIQVPVTISNDENTVTLKTETFQVNRAEFNIKYKSKTFFNDLKEKFINDDFDLQVTLVANK